MNFYLPTNFFLRLPSPYFVKFSKLLITCFEYCCITMWQKSFQVLILLDVTPDQSMLDEGVAREIVNRIQRLRKKVWLYIFLSDLKNH